MLVLLNSNFAIIIGAPLWVLVTQAALGAYSAGCGYSGWVGGCPNHMLVTAVAPTEQTKKKNKSLVN